MSTALPVSPRIRIGAAAIFSALLLMIAGVAALGRGTNASALTNCTVSDISLDSQEQAFLTLVNAYRAQNGRTALTVSTNLNRAATWHGFDMGQNSRFSHTDSLGRSPSTRAVDCGYPSGAGENIAAGTVWDTAQEAFNAWKNSSGHNANMLNTSYKQIGIARVYVSGSPYGYYWITNFGLVNDGTNGSGTGGSVAATPTPTRTTVAAPTPTPATTSAKATMSSPAPGSQLGTSATFTWTAGTGAREYFLYAGTSLGSNNMLGRSTGLSRSLTISGLPRTGQKVYLRLWTRFDSGWQYNDYSYTLPR